MQVELNGCKYGKMDASGNRWKQVGYVDACVRKWMQGKVDESGCKCGLG